MTPTTKEEWWQLVESNYNDLFYLIGKFHPENYRIHRYNITADKAEKVCENVRNEIRSRNAFNDVHPLDRFKKLYDTRNSDLASLLSETWFGMPESSDIRSEPGFFVLCDLCSESYVLEE